MADSEKKEILNPRQNNKTNRERRAQEEKQVKILRTAGIIAAALVVIAVIVGVILGIVNNPDRKAVATVGDDTITQTEFESAVSMYRVNINNNYSYMKQLYSMFGMEMDDTTRESYAYQMSDAYKGLLGQTVLSNMIDQRIMAYGAAQEGITVSDDEVETYYESMFGYYPNGTPTPQPTDEPLAPTATISEEQYAILRYTATPDPTEVAIASEAEAAASAVVDMIDEAEAEEAAETVETVAEAAEAVDTLETAAEIAENVDSVDEFVEAAEDVAAAEEEEAAAEVEEAAAEIEDAIDEAAAEAEEEAEPTEVPTVGPTMTPTEYTEDMFNAYETYYFANNYYYTKDFFKQELKYELMQDKVEAKLSADLPTSEDMVWARHILVETEEEAWDVLARFDAGEEFADLAIELSTDTGSAASGGDLGWFTYDSMVPEFSEAAFAAEVGTVTEPVQSDYGWHVIQVIAHEDHPYSSTQRSNALSEAFTAWLDKYAENLDIWMEEDITDITPVEPAFEE